MDEPREIELTADERAALDALPPERMPSRLLEERIVRELHARGRLRGRPAARRPATWRVAAAIGALALFGSGVAVGQRLDRGAQVVPRAGMTAALHVQQTGTEFVNSISAIVESSADRAQLAQAEQAALATFFGAASEIARLAPDDPLANEVLRVLQSLQRPSDATTQEVRHVVWF
jgi:hypothetical protein